MKDKTPAGKGTITVSCLNVWFIKDIWILMHVNVLSNISAVIFCTLLSLMPFCFYRYVQKKGLTTGWWSLKLQRVNWIKRYWQQPHI